MWAALITLVSSVLGANGPLGQYFKTKAETAKATADYQLQVEKARLDYAAKMADAAVQQQANQLQATSQTFKAFSYTFLTLPVLIVCVWPAWGKEIFSNLSLIPVWYAQLYVAVIGVIWGLPIAASAVSGIFSAVQTAWDASSERKIKKINALGDATALNLEQAKKEIFDTIKKATNLNGFTQAQVDTIGPVLDKVIEIQKNTQ
jgi:hypothetical protein